MWECWTYSHAIYSGLDLFITASASGKSTFDIKPSTSTIYYCGTKRAFRLVFIW